MSIFKAYENPTAREQIEREETTEHDIKPASMSPPPSYEHVLSLSLSEVVLH